MTEGQESSPAVLPEPDARLNPGVPFDESWIQHLEVDPGEVGRRAEVIAATPEPVGEKRVAALLQAVACTDLTTLAGDDTPDRVRALCETARTPIAAETLVTLGKDASPTAAVCVYPAYIDVALEALDGSGIPVATVAAGFPHGLSPLSTRIDEVRACAALGADEIDIVIRRSHALLGDWQALYDEVRAFREACGEAHLKVILATGELGTLRNVARASLVAMMAGADFIKTSTGKESVNATLPVGLVMTRAIREYHERTGHEVGFKPAGGIRTAKQALEWLILMKEELGDAWLRPDRFRFGASSLLGDIERQLEHHVTGRYSAAYRHPMA